MAEQQTLDTLVIKVVSDTTNAQEGLTKLADTLERIKGVSSGGKGFSNIQKNIDAITASMSKVESGGILKLKYLSQSLEALGEVKISKTIPDRLTAIGEAVDLLKSVDTSKFTEISQGMQTLSSVGNVRISGAEVKNAAATAATDNSSLVGMSKQTGEFIAETSAKLNQGKAMFADFADKAKTALGNVGLATLKLNAEMRKFFDAHNLSLRRFGSDIGKFLTAPFRKAQSVVKAFTGKFSNFFAMFKKRAMYRAINSIISAITDGFKTGTDNLYQYSKAIAGPFADSMDRIATALLYLKNGIGAAVGPLINMLAPAIEFCTDKTVEFLNTINQLFARLSGASSWTKAIRYPKEYAEAADDATKANEELKKTILGFDQLNVLQDNKSNNKKSGKQADDYSKMFEEVALTAATSPFADFFTPFKDAWENEGENTINAITTAFGQVKDLIDTVGRTVAEVWNNGTGQEIIEKILRTWQDIAGVVGNIAEKIKEAWDENENGKQIVQGIFDIFDSILGTIEDIAEATKDWSANLDLVPLMTSLAELAQELAKTFGAIGDTIVVLYKTIVLPILTWLVEDIFPKVIEIIGEIAEDIGSMAEATKEWAQNIDLSSLFESISNLFDTLKPVIDEIGNALVWVWENVILPIAKWATESALPAAIDLISAAVELFGSTIEAAKPSLKWFWENVLKPFGEWVGDKFIKALQSITDLIRDLNDVVSGKTSFSEFLDQLSLGQTIVLALVTALGLVVAGVLLYNAAMAIAAAVTALVTSPILLVVAAIAALIAVGVLLYQHWDEIKTFATETWGKIKDAVTGAWDAIKEAWQGVKDWFHDNVTQPIADFFTDVWNGISKAASDCWDAIVEFFSPAIEWFEKLFGSIWKTIYDVFYNIGVIASGCWEIIKKVWEIVSKWFDDNVVKPVAKFFKDLWEGIKDKAEKAWSNIKKVFEPVVRWFNTTIIQPVTKFFRDLWKGFSDKASDAWEAVKRVFSRVADFFKETFQRAWEGIVHVFSVGGEIFVNIKDGVLSAFKWVVNKLIDGINNVVAVPFNGINAVLRWLKDISIVGIQPFSGIREINVPQIPTLAQGGMVPNNGTMFIAGEAGAEVVANIGNRTGVMNTDQMQKSVEQGILNATGSIANAVAAAVAKSGQNGIAPTVEVTVKADSETLYKTVKKGEKYFNNRYHVVVGV